VAKVVDTPLHLCSFFGQPTLGCFGQSRIVDQVVDFGERDCLGEALDGGSAGEIQFDIFNVGFGVFLLDLFHHLLCGFLVAGANHN
jgi:hypothetical protein